MTKYCTYNGNAGQEKKNGIKIDGGKKSQRNDMENDGRKQKECNDVE